MLPGYLGCHKRHDKQVNLHHKFLLFQVPKMQPYDIRCILNLLPLLLEIQDLMQKLLLKRVLGTKASNNPLLGSGARGEMNE